MTKSRCTALYVFSAGAVFLLIEVVDKYTYNCTRMNKEAFAFLVAALIRVATGSATAAMTTGSGIVAPVLALTPDANVELVVLSV